MKNDAEAAWIRINDRLPELEQLVFLWDGKDIWIGDRSYLAEAEGWVWTNTNNRFGWDENKHYWDWDSEYDDEYKPTHWHPLPVPSAAMLAERAKGSQ